MLETLIDFFVSFAPDVLYVILALGILSKLRDIEALALEW